MVEKGGVKYVALFHPAAALHNASLINDLQRDFDGVRRYLDEVLKPPPPPEPVPEPEVDPEQLTLL